MKIQKKIALCLSIITSMSFFINTTSSFAYAEEKNPIEITSLRSEYEKHFDNGDGTYTAYINSSPIHFWQNEEWVDIDNTLILNEEGNYTNKSNSMNVTIPSEICLHSNNIDKEDSLKIEYNGFNISVSLCDLPLDNAETTNYQKTANNTLTDQNNFELNVIDNFKNDYSASKTLSNIETSFNNISSIAFFQSMADDTKLSFDVQSKSVIESVTFESLDSIPETITYFIESDSLDLKQSENGTIIFSNDNDESVFEIPTIKIIDSSIENKIINTNYEINEKDGGYFITIFARESLNEVNNLNYPLTVSSEYSVQPVQRTVNTYYNSEYSPYETIRNEYIRIGNVSGYGFQTYVSCSDSFVNYGKNATILDAKFNIFLRGNYISSPKKIKIYSIQTQPMNCSWNYDSTLNNYNTLVGDFNIAYSEMNSWKAIDVTALTQAWLNYGNSYQNIGIRNYGFKMVADSEPYATIAANSERASYNQPYFEINYSLSSNYTLDYAPHKYNDITSSLGNIYNFQKRMNCYAYALQIYNRNNDAHRLFPGEIGLKENGASYSFSQLTSAYYNAENIYKFMDFTEKQMMNDSKEMGTNLTRITLSNNNQFTLPAGYNENSQRIIAMNAATRYYDFPNSPSVSPAYDYHFYLRHGNGTCKVHNNGICSMWSHKLAEFPVSDSIGVTKICDENIATLATTLKTMSGSICSNYSQPLRFYTIEQDTNVYNSWYYYDSNQGNTIYQN